jgi:hypothetical protein
MLSMYMLTWWRMKGPDSVEMLRGGYLEGCAQGMGDDVSTRGRRP